MGKQSVSKPGVNMTSLLYYGEVNTAQNCCSTKKQIRISAVSGLLPACAIWEMP